ncbi:MAG: trypsin-like peptidase domain-containing protein, partial [Oscillospiraceae bacterium]|nr:trypsin-like peptidase domain-containing protein [Oscillospiraceae bacterium]
MRKRSVSLLAVLALTLTLAAQTLAAGTFTNFVRTRAYANRFTDVSSGAWYQADVRDAYEYGIVDGTSASAYEPDASLTLAAAIKLAACIHSLYTTGRADFTPGEPWYGVYADYAKQNGIIAGDYANYGAAARRSDFALIFANALPEEGLAARNRVDDGAIPDVPASFSYAPAVYKLYRAGILTGNDAAGAFTPDSNIKRSEVAAMVTRMANPEARKSVTLILENADGGDSALTAEQVAAKCSPAVFFLMVFDKDGVPTATGSGFFIADGVAVTNYHVIEGAYSARITTSDKKEYKVLGVFDYSRGDDLALLKIEGAGFPTLELGDSRSVAQGSVVYSIGSPNGRENSFRNGIVANPERELNGRSYIESTAPIAQGSSGGALVNAEGQVIGVTSRGDLNDTSFNLAVPIHLTETLARLTAAPLSDLFAGGIKMD